MEEKSWVEETKRVGEGEKNGEEGRRQGRVNKKIGNEK